MEAKDTVVDDIQIRDLLEAKLGKVYPRSLNDFVDFMARGIEVTKEAQAEISFKAGMKEVVEWAKDHYWDSLEDQKDMILLHLQAKLKEWGID